MTFVWKKKVISVLAMMFILSLSIVHASAEVNMSKITNLMINPDFEETGTWGGSSNSRKYSWYAQDDTPTAFNVEKSSSSYPAQHGSYYAETWGNEYQFYQYVPVDKNTTYVVSFWYRSKPASGTSTTNYPLFEVYGANNTTVIIRNNYPATSNWTQAVMCFNSGDNEKVRVCVTNKGSNGTILLDNYIMGICEPRAESVSMDGYAGVNNILSATANVSDPIGDKILDAEYQWQISSNGSDGWSDIKDADSDKYSVKKSDEGMYIRVKAVPKSESGNGVVKTGKAAYSKPIKVSVGTNFVPVLMEKYFTGKLLGTAEEAQNVVNESDSINGYLLNRDSILNALDESNGYVYSDVPYSMSLYTEKRAVLSGEKDLVLSLSSQNIDSVNVLMSYLQVPSVEQKAIVAYTDGTTEEILYTPGSIMEKTAEAPFVNKNPIGMIEVGGNADDESAGYLYSYTFDTNDEKEVESITFPYDLTEGKLLVFAATCKNISGEALKQIIVDKIQALPDTLTLDDRDVIENILAIAERYEDNGGNPNEIEGYSVLKTLLIDVKKHTVTSDLLDNTINIEFSNPVKIDTINKDTITISGLKKNQYDVEPVMDGENVVGAKIIVINDFSYKMLEITLSDKIASAVEPHFDLGQAYKITFTPKKLFEVKNKECTLNGTSLKIKADLKNNSKQAQNYYLICAVYSADNEMLYAFETSGNLLTNGTAKIDKQLTVPDKATSAKLFIWNGADTMKTIYQ